MAENKKVIISIVVDDKSAKKNLKDIGNETEKLGNKTNKANKGFLKLGKTFGAIARGFVIVKSFQELAKAISYAAKVGAEFELQMALTNRKLDDEIETVFLMTSIQYSYVRSTSVKEIARYGGCLDGLVPDVIIPKLRAKFS